MRGKREDESQKQKQQTRAVNNQGGFGPYLPSPQVWPRRQKIQRGPAKLAPIEEIKRTNAVVVRNFLQGETLM